MDDPGLDEAQIALLGLGLMGSSLALALREGGYAGRIVAYARRPETREQAVARGMVDASFDSPEAAMQGTSLAVVCTPVQYLAALCRSAMQAAPDAVVTDVGSTKGELARTLEGAPGIFVGSHPMCGSEQTGLDAGFASLYEGATVAVCPGKPDAAARVERLWSFVGAVPVQLDAGLHDRLVATSSHLPHLIASILVQTVAREGTGEDLKRFCATGFRDTTRVASGSADMWRGILQSNAPAIGGELKAFRAVLDEWIVALDQGALDELENELDRNAALRDTLIEGSTDE